MRVMSVKNRDSMNWTDNKDWYVVDKCKDRFFLTRKATTAAVKSFKKFLKLNGYPSDTPIFIDEVE